jgi:hypothetical protein
VNIIVKILPLFEDLVQANFLNFFQSNDFTRLVNDMGLESYWVKAQEALAIEDSNKKTGDFLGFIDPQYDHKGLLRYFLNILYEEKKDDFVNTIISFLTHYLDWTKDLISISNISKDLKSLGSSPAQQSTLQTAWQRYDNNLLSKVTILKNFLTDVAVGGNRDEDKYQLLKTSLLRATVIKDIVPAIVKDSYSLTEFWPAIQSTGGYAARRTFLSKAFAPLLNFLQKQAMPIEAEVLIDEQHINEVWRKALERLKNDPEGAITSARTLIETVCKHILDSLGETYDETVDLPKLYKLAATRLSLSPDQHAENAFKQILTGASSIVAGMAALRNKLSDAHGRRIANVKPSPRHAALTVNIAGAMSSFLLQTFTAYQAKQTSLAQQSSGNVK